MAQQLTEEQIREINTAFDDIDTNKSGIISTTELRAVLQLLGQNPTSEEMIAYMEHAVGSEFTKDEFFEFLCKYVPLKTQKQINTELMEAFEKFDDDKDFLISKEEFRKVMTKMGDEPLTEVDADALMESLKAIENNGKLNVEELSKLFMG